MSSEPIADAEAHRSGWRSRLAAWLQPDANADAEPADGDRGHTANHSDDLPGWLRAAPGLLLVVNDDGDVIDCNQAWQALLGFAPAELVGHSLFRIVHPDDAALLEGNSEGQQLELRLRDKAGHWHRLHWFRHALGAGRWLAWGEDVSEQRRTEAERDLFFEQAPGLQAVIGEQGELQRVGPGWQLLLGWPLATLVGRPLLDFLHPDDLDGARAYLRRQRAGSGEDAPLSGRFLQTDSRYRWLRWYARPVDDGRRLFCVGLDADELVEMQERFRLAFDHAAIGMALLSEDGQVLQANPALRKLLGLSPGDVQRMSLQDFTHPDEMEADLAYLRGMLVEDEDHFSSEQRYFTRDKKVVWAQLTVSRIKGGDGRSGAIICQLQDITERKASESRLLEANAELSTALAELRRYEEQMRSIHQLNQLLLVCRDRDEAYTVMRQLFESLLAEHPGFFAVLLSDSGKFQPVFAWGDCPLPPEPMAGDDCWALRRSEAHYLRDLGSGLACRHLKPAIANSLCLPLNFNGRLSALLHVRAVSNAADARLLEILGEVLKTSLSNLDLREHLSEQAIRDPLTGLFNRRHLEDCLVVEFERSRRKQTPVCLAMVDIDHFKRFNDSYGHDAGDEILRAVGRYLRDSVRRTDLVF
ncbi:MAG TPA: PAS domain S-box protein, partial [Arenimonas sp.]|nr:PAS domain S-box protein [Arenimonas sp.]